MANVLPSGTQDQTAAILAREAAANDALSRLFYTLMARREDLNARLEERRTDRDIRRQERVEDRDTRRQERVEDREAGNAEWDRRFDKGAQERRDSRTDSRVSPLSPGMGGSTGRAPAAPAIPPAPKAIPGSVAPVGLNTDKFSQAATSNDVAQADAEGDGTTTEFSARERTAAPGPSKAGTGTPRMYTPVPTSATLSRKPHASSLYPPIRDDIKAAWAAAEQKYKLPRGILQTALGLTNEGGYNAREQPRAGDGMGGWFGTTAELRKELGIDDRDMNDPIRMGDHAARNMRRNIDAYHKFSGQTGAQAGVKLPAIGNKVEDVPKILMLSQLGPVAGPRALATYHLNPKAPLTRVIPASKDSNGSEEDNARLLIRNGIPSNSTVESFYNDLVTKKVMPYHEETVRGQEGVSTQTQTPAEQEVAPPRPSQDVPTSDAMRFLQSRGGNVTNINPDYANRLAHVLQVAEQATGARARITDLYRSPETQAQYRANYIGAPVTYGGKRYLPQRRGGLAAPPGQSRHQSGHAGDVASGPVLDYLHSNPQLMKQAGVEFLPGRAGVKDPVHIQLTRGAQPFQAPPTTTTQVAAATQQPTPVAAAPVTKPSMQGAVNTFNAPKSAPIVTADLLGKGLGGAATGQQVQTAAVPDDATAAASQPTPQTVQPQVQATQAPPVAPPTQAQKEVASGYTADDASEHAPVPLSSRLSEPAIKVGTALSQQVPVSASDEAGMIDSLPYYVDEAKPGEGTNSIIQWIKERAKNYSPGMLNQSQQESEAAIAERVANPPPDTRGPVGLEGYSPGLLQPDAIRAMEEDIMQRRVDNPAPHTGINFNYSPGMLDPNAIRAAEQARILGEKPETAAVTQDPSVVQRLTSAIYNSVPSMPTVNVPDMSNWLAGVAKMPNITLPWGKGDAAATAKPVDTGPKKIRTVPLTPSGTPYMPTIPPLEQELLAKPQKSGAGSGLVISGGSLIPQAPGVKRYNVDPLTGRVIIDDPTQQQLEPVEPPPQPEEVEQ